MACLAFDYTKTKYWPFHGSQQHQLYQPSFISSWSIAQKCYTSFSHISCWYETTGLVITPSSFFFVFGHHNDLCLILFLLSYQIFDWKYKLFSFVSNSLAIFITAANCSFDSLSLCLLLLFQACMIISLYGRSRISALFSLADHVF